MMCVYESIYGIYNHFANYQKPPEARRPLASVAFHKAEDFTTYSLLEETMRIFRDLPIKEIFNINYLDFMKLPVDIVDLMIKIARERQEAESKIAINADKSMKASLKAQQQQVAEGLSNRRPAKR